MRYLGLTILSFNLTYDSQDLNTWPLDSLQLAGIEDPSRQTKVESAVDHSGIATYDPMASFSTLGTALKTRESSEQQPKRRDQSRPRRLKSKGGQWKRGRTTNLVPSDIIEEKEEVTKTRRSQSMVSTSSAKKEDADSSDGEEVVRPISEDSGRKEPYDGSIQEDTSASQTLPIPIDSAKQLPSEECLSRPDGQSVSDVLDIPVGSRRRNDSLRVPPHLDTSETSIVGTPADSFGYLLKKHRRRSSQPGGKVFYCMENTI